MNREAQDSNFVHHAALVRSLSEELSQTIVGHQAVVSRLLIGLLTGGHVLLEAFPGFGKTLLLQTLAAAIDLSFRRIQFTPDLVPADLTGHLVLDSRKGQFIVNKGPIFANVALVDDVDQAPGKVQSALLQAMREGQVTIEQTTHTLEDPFFVVATRNPIERAVTSPLREAQLDRFLLHVAVPHPSREAEIEIVQRQLDRSGLDRQPLITKSQFIVIRRTMNLVYLDNRIRDYIVDLARATRHPEQAGLADLAPMICCGVSPRGAAHLAIASKAYAFLSGRGFVDAEDAHAMFLDAFRHRVRLRDDVAMNGLTVTSVLGRVLAKVPIPQ